MRYLALLAPILLAGCFLDRSALDGDFDGGRAADGGRPVDAARADAGDGGVAIDAPTPLPDRDGDGVPDATDLCPDVPDPAQTDLDGDGLGDACDDDRDGDGIANAIDLCPDADSRGTPDEDGDGITNDCDACPIDADPAQPNADGDRLGDACEDPDPTRFSRVAFLATFDASLDGLSPSGDVDTEEHTLRMEDDAPLLVLRAENADHPGDYAVATRGVYHGPAGVAPSGTFAILLRWTDGPVGYALGVLAEDDTAEITRVDGVGCGFFGGSACLDVLASTGASCPDGSMFTMRATAFGSELALDFAVGTARLRQTAVDTRYTRGGVGLLVDHANVRFEALAIYAP